MNWLLMGYGVIVVLMGGFMIFSTFKTHRKFKELYAAQQLNKFELVDKKNKILLTYGILLALVILMLVFVNQTIEMQVISGALVLIVISEMFGSLQRFRLYYNDKHFVYEAEMYRFKSVQTIRKTKNWIRNYEIKFLDGKVLHLPAVMAQTIETVLQEKVQNKQGHKRNHK